MILEHIFWELTKFILSSQAVFNDADHTFVLRIPVAGMRRGKYALLGQINDAAPYRLNDALGQHVINTALSAALDDGGYVVFDEDAMTMNASLPEHLHDSKGYLLLSKLDISAVESEQYNLFTAVTDDGRFLTQEECEKVFLNGGCEDKGCQIPDAMLEKLHVNQEQHSKAKLKDIDSRNLTFFRQEEDRILKWEHDMLDELEEQIKVLRKSIQTAERDSRNATSTAMFF